jgi:hypothetical protein
LSDDWVTSEGISTYPRGQKTELSSRYSNYHCVSGLCAAAIKEAISFDDITPLHHSSQITLPALQVQPDNCVLIAFKDVHCISIYLPFMLMLDASIQKLPNTSKVLPNSCWYTKFN